ncbi:MAG: universal stress protein [Thermodesulfobacteriota bacterium]|jgi:Universal stress protein family.|nr:MAG: universal stress protein [Thermodesulfobacteriota bacterium]
MAQILDEVNKSMEGCVMLALSTFRRSEKAVAIAMEKCREIKNLMIVYVIDINVARYIVDAEEEFLIGLKEKTEAELLEKAEKDAREEVDKIAEEAKKKGIQVKTVLQLGRFAVVCLDVVKQAHPSVIVTTRSRRPEWVRKFFGSPVDELIAKAGCPVHAI